MKIKERIIKKGLTKDKFVEENQEELLFHNVLVLMIRIIVYANEYYIKENKFKYSEILSDLIDIINMNIIKVLKQFNKIVIGLLKFIIVINY
jgi:hypothetical protein